MGSFIHEHGNGLTKTSIMRVEHELEFMRDSILEMQLTLAGEGKVHLWCSRNRCRNVTSGQKVEINIKYHAPSNKVTMSASLHPNYFMTILQNPRIFIVKIKF